MSVDSDFARLSVGDLALRIRQEMIPLDSKFSYFFTAVTLSEDDIREYLREPVAALPPAVCGLLPKVSIVLVPYLEKVNEKSKNDGSDELICFEKPAENRLSWSCRFYASEEAFLAFGIRDQEMVDYHYRLYRQVAELTGSLCGEETLGRYGGLLREELGAGAHGEVDETSWHHKQTLLRRQNNPRRETKAFRDYLLRSLVDTLTLYLHGLCCDIDVETGPRQLPSRHLRRRLQLLQSIYPPPEGYAVFPEELNSNGGE